MDGMRELRWSDVGGWYDPPDAPLHDGCVVGAGGQRAVVELVRRQGWRSEELASGTLAVWPADGFQVNFFDCGGEDVDFDIDVRELRGQERLDLLSAFLRVMGQAFRAPVAMRGEGDDPGFSLFHYDPETDEFVLDAEPL